MATKKSGDQENQHQGGSHADDGSQEMLAEYMSVADRVSDALTEFRDMHAEILKDHSVKLGDPSGEVMQQYKDLPIGMLICEPILQVAKGQLALCDVYLDNLDKLAFETDEKTNVKTTKVLKFPYEKPIVDKDTGKVTTKTMEISAPLISLVPLPAFLMEEATVEFSLDVSVHTEAGDSSKSELTSHADFSFWGQSAGISGKVSSDSHHTRNTDNAAKYKIYARAAQQPAAEGMAKLTSLLAQSMEPIELSNK